MQKTVQLKELREKDIKTLLKESFELNKKLHEMRFKTVFRNLKNISEIRDTRKKIARINTVINEKLILELTEKELAKKESK